MLRAAADPRGRRGRLRRAAAAAVRRVGVDLEAVPRARGRAHRAGAGRGRGRQVHDVPGDGQGRRRRGGARALDAKVPRLGHRPRPAARRRGLRGAWNARHLLAQRSGLHVARDRAPAGPLRLADRRGARAGRRRPDAGRAAGRGADDYLRVEVVYAASHEGARHLDDVLARRTRISIETWDRGVGVDGGGGPAGGAVLGWSEAQVTREVEHYRKRVEAERESQTHARRRDRRRRPHRRPRGRPAPLGAARSCAD